MTGQGARVAVAWRQEASACSLREAFACGPMAPGACATAVVDLRDWHPWLDQAWAMLDAPHRQRVSQRRFAADREALALTYALHRLFVARALDLDEASVVIARDAEGAPWLPGVHLRGRPVRTSLSHADGVAAFALCAAGPVGVDIEAAFRAAELPGIAASVCHPDEWQSLAGFPEPACSRALLALWVRKEALLKAEGIGLAREMSSFHAAAGAEFLLAGHAREPAACSVRLAMLDVGERWTAAVAAPREAAVECLLAHPLGNSAGRTAGERALYLS
ncbi:MULTISPECIES: 4'-phosphopantetheinyl transferase superfamily protein [unclassified Lysobacter]|uniref:4'-phosphopantetheinyl transferase family protein n=1 Tax=unclassified Lysobacter TaxID=2635362 RepID=UPI001C22080C|nr:4'-phosphopantetheinyl transferase superfamily protein [Lysobacter sp. MMG2]MBU8974945.1 4'-phosphopantetheinyl transferase superfamily protein [Lysobacter sp. MMG2]